MARAPINYVIGGFQPKPRKLLKQTSSAGDIPSLVFWIPKSVLNSGGEGYASDSYRAKDGSNNYVLFGLLARPRILHRGYHSYGGLENRL